MAKYRITDDKVNNHKYRILTDGVDISDFLLNPVLLYNHRQADDDISVYGRWENLETENQEMTAEPVFDEKDKMGRKLARKVKDGFIHAVSISVRPLETSDAPELMLPGQVYPTIIRSQLREISFTDVPGKGNSVRLQDEDGNEIDVIKLSDFTGKATARPAATTIQPTPTMEEIKFVAATLGLNDTAQLSEVNASIRQLKDKAAQVPVLEQQIKTLKDAEEAREAKDVDALLSAAEKDGRITSAQRTSYKKLFDLDQLQLVLADKQPVPKLHTVTPDGGGHKSLSDGKYNGKTWDELDREEGALAKLKDTDNAGYRELYKHRFGSYPA